MACVNVVLAGTGSAINPMRGQVSVILDLGGTPLVVDVGCNAPRVAESLGYKLDEVEFYVVTHTHYDHLCGLPMVAFMKTFRSREPKLNVYTTISGSWYVERLLELVLAGESVGYKIQGVGPGVNINVGDVTLRFIEADHTIEALGVIVKYSGLKIIISGDTRPTRVYKEEARGSHLAIHEATLPSNMASEARRTGHSTVGEALEQVVEADQAVLYHITTWSENEALEVTRVNRKVLVPLDGTMLRIC